MGTVFDDELDAQIRVQKLSIYRGIIERSRADLAEAYPYAEPGATDITWPDFQSCLWNASGAPGGVYNNIYYGRRDVQQIGMTPTYLIGGTFAEKTIWGDSVPPIPMTSDYIANPDLFTIIVIVFLIIVAGVLLWSASARRQSDDESDESDVGKPSSNPATDKPNSDPTTNKPNSDPTTNKLNFDSATNKLNSDSATNAPGRSPQSLVNLS